MATKTPFPTPESALPKRSGRRAFAAALLLLAVLLAAVPAAPARAQETAPLDEERVLFVGMELQPTPANLVVPKNTGTIVSPLLVRTDDVAGELPPLPDDAVFLAELSGPAFGQPIPVSALPNQPFNIPPLPLAGQYALDNIRLVSGGQTLLAGNPSTVRIEVIDRILDVQVTSRPLTAEEIQQRGIVIDQENYQVINFTVAFGLENEQIKIDFPMIMPRVSDGSIPGTPGLFPMPHIGLTTPPEGVLSMLSARLQTPNIQMSGYSLEEPDPPEGSRGLVPPLPGAVIIPGNIGYLNQFFSVILKTSNMAPPYANLEVRDLRAEIVLPPGDDGVLGTGDDPLRMARLGDPPTPQATTQSSRQPGPDGRLNTADDVLVLRPQQTSDAEFLVEGRREGVHQIKFNISGVLHGLPNGPVEVRGAAAGVVEVRNPRFSLIFHHPETITAGEEYDFDITVSNISNTPANFVTLNLLSRSISGATLLSDQTVQLESIAGGDAATARFRLRAQRTGTVVATSLASNDLPGRFDLRMAVGELGIPMSPNVIVLPKAARSLPQELLDAATGLLGQAFALATAPVTPEGLLPMGRDVVYERASDVASAGQRFSLHDPMLNVARDLALDFMGNNYSRIDQDYAEPHQLALRQVLKRDFRGFDQLLRSSRRGELFLGLLGEVFAESAQSQGVLSFQADFAEATASRPGHISVVTGDGVNGAPVTLVVTDPLGDTVGKGADGVVTRSADWANYFSLGSGAGGEGQLALFSTPQNGLYSVDVYGMGAGQFDLGLVVPEGQGLRRVNFSDIAIQAGGVARLTFSLGGSANNSFALAVDTDGDGTVDATRQPDSNAPVVDRGPRLISSVQIITGGKDWSKFGILISALFSEEISLESSQSDVESMEQIAEVYQVDANMVRSVKLQPRGRVVLMYLRDGVGHYIVPRNLAVSGVEDRLGHPMEPATQTVAIEPKTGDPLRYRPGGVIRGTVRRPDGTPVPFAQLFFSQIELDLLDERFWETPTVKPADADGSFQFDYVRQTDTRLIYVDPETNEQGVLYTRPSYDGQIMTVDLILMGRGTLAGHVYAEDGVTPLEDAAIRVTSLNRGPEEGYMTLSDATGAYVIGNIPVGPIAIQAAHAESRSTIMASDIITTDGQTLIRDLVLLSIDNPQHFGTLEGQVFRANGEPAAGVSVSTSRGGNLRTDASGFYRLENVPVGPITVTAQDPVAFEQALSSGTIVAGQSTTINLIITGGYGSIRGSVIDTDFNPVPGVLIYGGVSVEETDENGEFTMENVPITVNSLTAYDPGRNVMQNTAVRFQRAGEEVTVQFVLPVTGVITGRVQRRNPTTMALEPVSNLKIFALGPTNEVGFTDGQGNYRFENMVKGEYTISAFYEDFSDGNFAETRIVFKDEVRRADIVFRGKGTVRGIVFDDDGVTPLGARVGLTEWMPKIGRLVPNENPECLGDIDLGNGEVIDLPACEPVAIEWEMVFRNRRINSDVESGRFTFPGVFVGEVVVEAANAFSPDIVSQAAEVPTIGATTEVTLSLLSTGVITGVVYDIDGTTPVTTGAIVELRSTMVGVIRVQADENGAFDFPLVPAGGHTITVEDTSRGLTGQTSTGVAAGQTSAVSVRLLRQGSVTVEVTGAGGAPEEHALVQLTEGAFTRRILTGETDAAGRITFTGADMINEGSFSVGASKLGVRASGGGQLRSIQEDPTGHVTVTLSLANDTGTVTGRFLRGDGLTPIPNAQIELVGLTTLYFTTDTAGSYHFEGVRLGAYNLRAYDPLTGRRGRATVNVAQHNETYTVDMVQIAWGTVTGTVRRSDNGAPVANARVTLNPTDGGGALLASTGVNGVYTIVGVPAGRFNMRVEDWVNQRTGYASGEVTQEGQTVTLDVAVQVVPTGRVQGTVRDAYGNPALGAEVRVASTGGGTLPVASVDNSGFYFFDGVATGDITINVSSALDDDFGYATGRLVSAGDAITVPVQLNGTAPVSGVVVYGDGRPATGVTVRMERSSRTPPFFPQRTVNTSIDGEFAFAAAPLGPVSFHAQNSVLQLGGSTTITTTEPGVGQFITITLEAAGTLRGRALNEDGTAAERMALELVGRGDARGISRFGSTGEDGSFEFSNLRLGEYDLTITDPLAEGLAHAAASLTTQGEMVDMGGIRMDRAAPQVVAISPANTASSVPVTTTIVVTFSEPIDPATATAANLQVMRGAVAITGTWALSAGNSVATFTPSQRLPDFAVVNARVRTGIRDRVGRALAQEASTTFTTTDATPPAIVSRSPLPNAEGVTLNTVVRIGYSEAIDPAAFTGPAISLRRAGVEVPGVVTPILNNTALVFTPSAPLPSDSLFEVTVLPATDRFHNTQPSVATYSFRTMDLVAPVVEGLVSSAGTTVRAGSTATITATVPATDTAQVEFFVDGVSRAVVRSAPYRFDLPVPANSAAQIVVAAQATDRSGNVSVRQTLTLAVQHNTAPQVTILEPQNGAPVDSGSRLYVTVRATDEFGLRNVLFQASGAATRSVSFSVPNNSAVYTATFSVDVPSTALPGSTLNIQTSAVDVNDTASAVATLALPVADATAPTAQITAPAAGSSVIAGAPFTVTVRAGDNGPLAAVELQAAGGVVYTNTQPISATTSPVFASFVVPVPANATPGSQVTLTARSRDGAGTWSAPATLNVVVRDGAAPAVALDAAAGAASIVQGGSITMTVRATDTVGVNRIGYRVAGGFSAGRLDPIAPALPSLSRDFTLFAPLTATVGSTITVTGVARDAALNEGVSQPLVLAIVADAAPTATIVSPADGGAAATGVPLQVTVAVTDDIAVAAVHLQASGAVTASAVYTVTPAAHTHTAVISLPIPDDAPLGGSFSLSAVAVDSRGQQSAASTVSLTVDADQTRPTVTIDRPANGSQVIPGDVLQVWTTATDNLGVSAVHWEVSGTLALSDTMAIEPAAPSVTEPFDFGVPPEAASGEPLTITVRAEDASGNLSAPAQLSLTISDVIRPQVSLAASGGATEIVRGREVQIVVTSSDDYELGSVRLRGWSGIVFDETRELPGGPRTATTSFTVTAPTTATVEYIQLRAYATDTAGNEEQSSLLTLNLVSDDAPQVSILAPANGSDVESGRPFTVTVQAVDDNGVSQVDVALAGGVALTRTAIISPALVTATASFRIDVPVTAVNQPITITAGALDTRALRGSATLAVNVVDVTPPTLSAGQSTSSPAPGGVVTFSYNAADNAGVAAIELTTGGLLTETVRHDFPTPGASVSYSKQYTIPADAPTGAVLTVSAAAVDLAGNRSAAAVRSATVRDVLAPQVNLAYVNGANTVQPGDVARFVMDATDNVGVWFMYFSTTGAVATSGHVYLNPVQPAASQQFEFAVPANVPIGSVITVTGEARDATSNITQAQPITFTVSAPTGDVHGLVTRSGAGPVANAAITVIASNGAFTGTADGAGLYAVPGAANGPVTVYAVEPGTGLRGRAQGTVQNNAGIEVNVTIFDAPSVAVTAPPTNTTVTENILMPITVTAQSGAGLAHVRFVVNDTTVFTDTAAPYVHQYRVPAGVPTLDISAVALDSAGNSSTAAPVRVNVVADTNTTAVGRVIDSLGQPVAGATVRASGNVTGTTAADGRFAVSGVPTILGDIQVIAYATVGGQQVQGVSAFLPPVPGSQTDFGDITLQIMKVWDGGGDGFSWHQANNWSDNTLPGASDNVYIPAGASVRILQNVAYTVRSLRSDGHLSLETGTLSLAAASQVRSMSQTAGVLTGAGDLTASQVFTWTGGTHSGAGHTLLLGAGVFRVNTTRFLDAGRTLENRGQLTWQDGNLTLNNGAKLVNAAGATLEIQGARQASSSAGVGTIENYGTMRRTGAGVSYIYTGFTNRGAMRVESGALELHAGGVNEGLFDVQAGATLTFAANWTSTPSATVTGAGRVVVNSSRTLTVQGAYSVGGQTSVVGTLNAVADMVLPELDLPGTLTGTATVTVTGVMTWSDGTLSGFGKTVVTGRMDAVTNQTRDLYERSLELRGQSTWSYGTIRMWAGGTLVNAAGATFEIVTDADRAISRPFTSAEALFENYGALVKRGAATATLNVALVNRGAIDIQAGQLIVQRGGANEAAISVAAGAYFSVDSVYTHAAGASLAGAGAVYIGSSDLLTVDGAYTVRNTWVDSNSTFLARAALTVPQIQLTGGQITGTASITVTDVMTWNSGELFGPSTGNPNTVVAGRLVMGTSGAKDLAQRTLELRGQGVWNNGAFRMWAGGKLVNAAGATFEIVADANRSITIPFTSAEPLIENYGTLVKSGAALGYLSVALVNRGTVDIRQGQLVVQRGGSNEATINVQAGAWLNVDSAFTHAAGAALAGPGSLYIGSSDSLRMNGAYALSGLLWVDSSGQLNAGAALTAPELQQTGGQITGTADITVTNVMTWSGGEHFGPQTGNPKTVVMGRLVMGTSGTKDLAQRTLELRGQGLWNNGAFRLWANGRLVNAAGATFEVAVTTARDVTVPFQGVAPLIENNGTLLKSGAAQVAVAPRVVNNGIVRGTGGTLAFTGGVDHRGIVEIAAGAVVEAAGTSLMQSGALATGDGVLRISGGTTTIQAGFTPNSVLQVSGGTADVQGDLEAPRLHMSGGVLTGATAITVTQNMTWTGGELNGTGRLVNMNRAVMSGTATKSLYNRTFVNRGAFVWSGTGWLWYAYGGRFINEEGATIEGVDVVRLYYPGWAPTPTFENRGRITKSGPGTMQLDGAVVHSGQIEVQGGRFLLNNSGGTLGGIVTVGSGALLEFTAAATVSEGAVVSGAGSVLFTSGAITYNGVLDVSGSVRIDGGTTTFGAASQVLNTGGSLTLAGGTFNLSSANGLTLDTLVIDDGDLYGTAPVTVTQAITWSGSGDLDTGGSLANLGRMVITGSDARGLYRKTLLNRGTVLWNMTGWLWSGYGGRIVNDSGATFEANNAVRVYYPGWAPISTFENRGQLVKSGSGVLRFEGVLTNSGQLDVQAGTLQLANSSTAGNTLGGAVNVAAGASLDINTNTTVPDGATVSGAGSVLLSGGTVSYNGVLDVTGGVRSNATLTFGPTATIANMGGRLAVGGGTLALNSGEDLTLDTLELTNGVLTGASALTVTHTLTWTDGDIDGPGGQITSLGRTAYTGTGDRGLYRRTFTNRGVFAWSGTGQLWVGYGSRLHNEAGATLELHGAARLYYPSWAPAPAVENRGTVVKLTGDGVARLDAPFANAGVVRVQAGGLRIAGALTQQAGGEVVVHIGGPTPNTQLHQLVVDNAAALTGTLSIVLDSGYLPAEGVSLAAMTYGSRTGAFDVVNGLDLGNGTHFVPTYNATSLVLAVQPGGMGAAQEVDAAVEAPAEAPETVAPPETPAVQPTAAPTVEPTVEPVDQPTVEPTAEPTAEPAPTQQPGGTIPPAEEAPAQSGGEPAPVGQDAPADQPGHRLLLPAIMLDAPNGGAAGADPVAAPAGDAAAARREEDPALLRAETYVYLPSIGSE